MLDQSCKTKIGKMLPMLASDKPGEVVSAVAAINRVLKSHNSNLHELVTDLAAPKGVTNSHVTNSAMMEQIIDFRQRIQILTDSRTALVKENNLLKKENISLKSAFERSTEYNGRLARWILFLFIVIVVMYLIS